MQKKHDRPAQPKGDDAAPTGRHSELLENDNSEEELDAAIQEAEEQLSRRERRSSCCGCC